MTADERTAKFIAELDEIERMTPDQARDEIARLQSQGGFLGVVARTVYLCDCQNPVS